MGSFLTLYLGPAAYRRGHARRKIRPNHEITQHLTANERTQKKEGGKASIESRKRRRQEFSATPQSPIKKRAIRKEVGSSKSNKGAVGDTDIRAGIAGRGRHVILPERLRR
jgi:hypothetical protein